MKPLTSTNLRGNWCTLLLPINEDESIDEARLIHEIDLLTSLRVDGIYNNGTAGEFYAQTEQEFDRINLLLAERCEKSGTAFQIGASHMSPHISLARIKRAAQLQPGAIQVILPDWYPASDDEAIAFLSRAAEAADPVGLMLYNPPHAKRVLNPPDYDRLKTKIPALIGIKVLDGGGEWYAAMRQYAAGLAIFVPGHHLATGIREGAHGSYSNVACLSPQGAQWWYEQMQFDMNSALEIESRLRHFIQKAILPFATQAEYSNQALDKLLAAIGSWADIGTRLRWPYRWIPESEAERIRPLAQAMLPEFLNTVD